MTEGRINIHLKELKEKLLLLHPGYGKQSEIVRTLVESYLEGRIMHLSPEISQLLDKGKDDEAIALLTSDLVALRQRRVQAGQSASKKRSSSKAQKAKDKAGIKTPEQQIADKLVEDMLKAQEAGQINIEIGGEDGLERPDKDEETYGLAKKVDRTTKE